MMNPITEALIRERLQKIFAAMLEDHYDYESTRLELQRLLSKSIELNLPIYQVEALKNLGILHAINGELQEGMRYHEEAHALAVKHQYTSGIFNALNNLSNIYDRMGQSARATRLIREALKLAQAHVELKPRIILAGTNLGNLLCSQELYLEAEETFKYCLKIYNELTLRERRDDVASRHLMAIYSGLAMIYIERRKYRIAREYLMLADGMLQEDSIFGRLLIMYLVGIRLAYHDPETSTELDEKLAIIDSTTTGKKTSRGEAAHLLYREAHYWQNHAKPDMMRLFAERSAQLYKDMGDSDNLAKVQKMLT